MLAECVDLLFFFSSRRRHTRLQGDWSSDVCSSDLGGSVSMSAWLDGVPALIEMWYPGQEGGRALAEIIFGEVNPSGRLPVTFERRWEIGRASCRERV